MSSRSLLTLLALFSAATSSPILEKCSPSPEPLCQDIMVPITASGNLMVLPPFNSTTASPLEYIGNLDFPSIPHQNVSGTFNISMRFCKPSTHVEGRQNTIQMLLHGVAYTKTYWDGIGFDYSEFPEEYSWVAHAGSQGYATLAIDNLGNGDSEHPDPINVVQTPLQIDIMHSIVQRLRIGSISPIPQSFEKVIFAGYSYGSIVGRSLATLHPTDGADAYILEATSNNMTALANPSFFFAGGPASVVRPSTFKLLPPGYRAFPADGLRDALYSYPSDFDHRLLSHDEQQPHAFAMGELISPSTTDPSNFTGSVLVLTGKYDQIVCGTGNFTASPADCGVGKTSNPDMTRLLFPKAKFDSYEPDHTGHNINLHYSASESFGAAHQWLESAGF